MAMLLKLLLLLLLLKLSSSRLHRQLVDFLHLPLLLRAIVRRSSLRLSMLFHEPLLLHLLLQLGRCCFSRPPPRTFVISRTHWLTWTSELLHSILLCGCISYLSMAGKG